MAGPPPPEQIEGTLRWVSEVFSAYYRDAPPPLPPRYGRREFGFLWNGKTFFVRHTSFSGAGPFHDYLVREAPHHCYYSTAYYKTPHASTMKEKEWLGADLIFDLDADHLENAKEMSFDAQLAAVKKEARKLLHEFLLGDFGFAPEHVRIVFSGGRGYHFHVTDPRVLSLGSAERREIVDYLSPNETVAVKLYEGWAREKALMKDRFGEAKKDTVVPPADAPGWEGRITRAAADFLQELLVVEPREAQARLTALPGIGPKTALDILSKLDSERIQRIRDTGRLETVPALGKSAVVKALIEKARLTASGETDEPVTADIKRLIRLPGSLHGKTGLRVTPLTIDEFERFDPLRDAVALGDAPVRVVVSKPTDVPLCGERLHVEPGEQELPLYAAMFVSLRRAALRPLDAAPSATP